MAASAQIGIWRRAQAVCFDVDSTVTVGEGIDELADFCGVGEVVAQWPWAVEFRSGRLYVRDWTSFRPSRTQVRDFLMQRPPVLTPGVSELVASLQRSGVAVFLISGGFRQLIDPIQQQLSIPSGHVFANTILFDDDGEYAGFDEREPTSETGGKARAIEGIRQQHGFSSVVMVGDGVTDLEAKGPADMVIGFGGNVVRERVAQEADWFVRSFAELLDARTQADDTEVGVRA